jgi:sec-independent protein translocase protein TatB
MFDIGWAELAVIGVIALIVVGPKDLPVVLRTGASWIRQMRKLSREFQSGVDSIVREAELDDAKKIVTSVKQGTIKRQIETAIDPTGEMKRSLDPKNAIREGDAASKPASTAKSAAPAAAPSAAPSAATPVIEPATADTATVDAGPAVPSTVVPAPPPAKVPAESNADSVAPSETPVEPARSTGS